MRTPQTDRWREGVRHSDEAESLLLWLFLGQSKWWPRRGPNPTCSARTVQAADGHSPKRATTVELNVKRRAKH
jgi:hypothetical protein